VLTWHFWPLQKRREPLPILPSASQRYICAPSPGIRSQIQFCCRVRTPKPSSQPILQCKKSLSPPTPHISPLKCPHSQVLVQPRSAHSDSSSTSARRQAGSKDHGQRLLQILSFAGRQPPAAGLCFRPAIALRWEVLSPGPDQVMTRAGVQGLGLCPGRGDDQSGKKLMPLPVGS